MMLFKFETLVLFVIVGGIMPHQGFAKKDKLIYNRSNQYEVETIENEMTPREFLKNQNYPSHKIESYLEKYFFKINPEISQKKEKISKGATINFHFYKCFLEPKNKLCRPSRTRSTKRLLETFSSLKPSLRERLENIGSENIAILDVGMGYGRILTEFAGRLRRSQIWGINKGKEERPRDLAQLKEVAKFYNVPIDDERKNKIQLVHQNLDEKPIETSGLKFDVIYSQKSIKYMREKIKVLRQIYELLKPGGTAFLEIDYIWVDDKLLCDHLKTRKPTGQIICDGTYFLLTKSNKPFALNGLVEKSSKPHPNRRVSHVYYNHYLWRK